MPSASYGFPSDVESYIQETGRAERDENLATTAGKKRTSVLVVLMTIIAFAESCSKVKLARYVSDDHF